ncbi:hypothetical protein L9F63_004575, partial [Diploptera punctata]
TLGGLLSSLVAARLFPLFGLFYLLLTILHTAEQHLLVNYTSTKDVLLYSYTFPLMPEFLLKRIQLFFLINIFHYPVIRVVSDALLSGGKYGYYLNQESAKCLQEVAEIEYIRPKDKQSFYVYRCNIVCCAGRLASPFRSRSPANSPALHNFNDSFILYIF